MSKQETNRPDVAEATLQGPYGTIPFRLFKTDVCFQVANDIFAGTTYPNVPFVSGVKTVLDIGANVGAASLYLATSLSRSKDLRLRAGKRRTIAAAKKCGATAERDRISFRACTPGT